MDPAHRPHDLGVGIGLRREHWDALVGPEVAGLAEAREAATEGIDFLEVLVESFAGFGGRPREVLDRCAARWPIVLHGVALSIGGSDPLDDAYLDRVAALAERTRARWWSDHLAYATAGGVHYHDLLPLPFTAEAVDHVAARAARVRARVGLPFLLENPTYYARWSPPGVATMDEATFLRAALEAADCGLLLDVNNVYVNAANHGYDARAFIDALPLERVRQIHLAGPTPRGRVLIDSHATPVRDAVLDLYAFTIARTGPVATLLEWDHDVPPLATMLAELDRIRAARARGLDAPR